MARHRNTEWDIKPDVLGNLTWIQVQAAVLMDIRAELQTLNRVFACPNFTRIPQVLDRISRNTVKPRKKSVRRKSRKVPANG